MKKKSLIILMSLMMSMCCVIGLTACGHTHTEAVLEEIPATCTEVGWTAGSWCPDCGEVFVQQTEIPATGHTPKDGEYVSDGLNHWTACANCELGIREQNGPCSGGTATCDAKAICEVCNNEYGETLEHNYSVYASDANMHWLECSECGAEKERSKEVHVGGTATCSTQKKCSVCSEDYGAFASHDFTGDYFFDDNGHWHECNNCGTPSVKSLHYGGNATCSTKAQCEACNRAYGGFAGHNYSTGEYDFNGEGHWKVCSVCHQGDEANLVAHSGGKSSCLEKAVCEYCDAIYGEIGEHDFANGTYHFDEEEHWKQCKNCPEISDRVAHAPKTQATCTKKAVCKDCGETYGDFLAHDFTNGTWIVTDTQHAKQCKNCTATDVADIHTQGTPADCLNAAVCSVCENSYGSALGHSMSGTWESSNTKHWQKCLNEGCTYIEKESTHLGGTATCQAKAVCTECGNGYGQLADHNMDMGNWVAMGTSGHAHKCLTVGCTFTDTVIAHMGNIPQATEQQAKICTECAFVMEPNKNHVHVKASVYSHDAESHWYGCTGCAEYRFEETVVPHDFANACDSTCDTCGETRATSHDYSVSKYNTSYHWTACSVCDEAKPGTTLTHSGGTATCTTKAVCGVCEHEYGAELGHEFNSSAIFGYDGTHHWKKCARCGEADTNKIAHDGSSDSCDQKPTCTVCKQQYGEGGSHDFSGTTYVVSSTQHWKTCTRCGAAGTKTNHAASASAVCGQQAVCATCNESYGSALAHDFSGPWKSNASYHWRTCSRTGCTGEDTSNRIAHAGGTATCSKQAVCSTCSKSYGATSNNHSYTSYKYNDSYHWGVCKDCQYEDSANSVRHSGGTATCSTQATCSTCKQKYGQTTAHDFTKKYGSNSTQHWGVCNGCGLADTNKVNHSGGTATCQVLAKCSACNTSYGSKGAHVQDTAVWGSVTRSGHARKCKTAGCTYTYSASGHNFSESNSEWMYGYCWDCGFVNAPANTNSNLKHFGYFHTDGTNGGGDWTLTGARSWFKDIAELGNSDYVMLSNTNEPSYVAERLKEAKKYGLKAIGGIDLWHGAVLDPRTANSASLVSNWESILTNYINTIKEYIIDGTFLGFMFDEPIWNGVKQSDFRTVTKKMRDLTINLAPGGKGVERLHCMCLAELGEYLGENNAWRVSASTNEYCTGVMYDVYSAWDQTVRTRYLNKLKSVATHGQGIWGCLDGIPGASEDVDKCQRNLIMQYREALSESRYAGIAVFTYDDGGDWTHGSKDYMDYSNSRFNANYRRVNIAIGKAVIGKDGGVHNGSATFHMTLADPNTVYNKGASVKLASGKATNGLGTGLSVSYKITTPSGKTSSVSAGASYTLSEVGNYAYTMTAKNGSLTQSKTVYYSTRDAHEITTYDTFAHNYDQHGTGDQVWCFAREVIQYDKRSGLGCLRVKPHATDGSWMTIKVGYSDSTTYNLSSASYVSMWVYNTGNSTLPGICLNASNGFSGNIATTSVDIPAKTWTEVKITKEQMTAKGLNLSKINLHINNSKTFSYRPVFYIDDIMWYS